MQITSAQIGNTMTEIILALEYHDRELLSHAGKADERLYIFSSY